MVVKNNNSRLNQQGLTAAQVRQRSSARNANKRGIARGVSGGNFIQPESRFQDPAVGSTAANRVRSQLSPGALEKASQIGKASKGLSGDARRTAITGVTGGPAAPVDQNSVIPAAIARPTEFGTGAGGFFSTEDPANQKARGIASAFEAFKKSGKNADTGSFFVDGEKQAAPVQVNKDQRILNPLGRQAVVEEERRSPVEKEFLNQFTGGIAPSPITNENGQVIGLNNKTGRPGVDALYLQLFSGGGSATASDLRASMENELQRIPGGQQFLNKLDENGQVRMSELEAQDKDLFSSIGSGSDLASKIEENLVTSSQERLTSARDFFTQQREEAASSAESQKESLREQAAALKDEYDVDFNTGLASALSAAGFDTDIEGNLTRTEQARKRAIMEEFNSRRDKRFKQIDDALRTDFNSIDSNLANVRSELANKLFDFENGLLQEERTRQSGLASEQRAEGRQISAEERAEGRSIAEQQRAFDLGQLEQLQTQRLDLQSFMTKAEYQKALEDKINPAEVIDILGDISKNDNPEAVRAQLIALNQQMADAGLSVNFEDLLGVYNESKILSDLRKRAVESDIARTQRSNTGKAAKAVDPVVSELGDLILKAKAGEAAGGTSGISIIKKEGPEPISYDGALELLRNAAAGDKVALEALVTDKQTAKEALNYVLGNDSGNVDSLFDELFPE